MKEWYKDFVGIYENAYSKEWCDNIIEHIENSSLNSRDKSEGTSLMKKDLSCFFSTTDDFSLSFIKDFFKNYWSLYTTQYPVLNDYELHTIYNLKGQKTKPSEGYHVWHSEDGSFDHSKRIAVYTVYLNDVEEGGETEFLYQNLRVPAKQGTLCIFPASYTHVHRGNPPLTNNKYILTGWIEKIPPQN
jgi:hypothetical protein